MIGEDISSTNRGNKIDTYDHANTTRIVARQANFESDFERKTAGLKEAYG